ncbi:hypothetical protein BsWGS_19913 [Bradybaena similaris]
MWQVSAKFSRKLLLMEQKQMHVEVLRDLLGYSNGKPDFRNTIIAGDELWVFGYDPNTKVQSLQWKHSSSPRAKMRGRCVAVVVVVCPSLLKKITLSSVSTGIGSEVAGV